MDTIDVKSACVYEKKTGKFVRNYSYVELACCNRKWWLFNNSILVGEYDTEQYYLEILG